MSATVVITQNIWWLHNRLVLTGLYKHPNTQHDFLSTGKGEYYGETERYFFKYVNIMDIREIRLFKKSKRVTVSKYRTTK